MKATDTKNGTEPIRLDTDVLNVVRKHKEVTGFPIARFIEDAIIEKADKLSEDIKFKMGIKKGKK
jgi:hypothetical protein